MTDQQSQTINRVEDVGEDRADAPVSRPMLMLIAVAILTSAASLMVSRDMLVREHTQAALQTAADRAAIAGAAYLPGWPTRALRAAEQSAELSGLKRSNMVYATVAPDGMSFRVAFKCEAPVLILGLFRSGAEVTAISMIGARHVRRPGAADRFSPTKLDPGTVTEPSPCADATVFAAADATAPAPADATMFAVAYSAGSRDTAPIAMLQ
jgi:hypothetical protein